MRWSEATNPLTLEFLGLKPDAAYSETKLENAIISKMQHFLLELGKGFLFEARQKRFTFDEDDFFVDLVFYNRLLQCYVLIDLKVGKLTHQDLGQMQMYVNYYDRYVKRDFRTDVVSDAHTVQAGWNKATAKIYCHSCRHKRYCMKHWIYRQRKHHGQHSFYVRIGRNRAIC